MKSLIRIVLSTLFISLVFSNSLLGQDSTKSVDKKNNGQFFVDKDGDGYNDNAPDHDGDGVPNGLDPDWQKLQKEKKKAKRRFVDLDGDGINDNLQNETVDEKKLQNIMNEKGSSMETKQQNQKGAMQKQKGKKP